jgi:hypothetical protein
MSAPPASERAARALPGVILKFLERASVALACTRDARNVPRIHWVSAWEAAPDRRSLWCHIPAEFAAGLDETLAAGGPFALTVEHIGPHESYQFKGRTVEGRPAGPAERALAARSRERFSAAVVGLLPHLAGQEPALLRYILDPALSVRLDVREIYLQTPGPGAGSLLARLEDAP